MWYAVIRLPQYVFWVMYTYCVYTQFPILEYDVNGNSMLHLNDIPEIIMAKQGYCSHDFVCN